ncbi:MAG: peroxiredoxin [Epsilonproteobacteria bacterium]|jgi:peroxiredoxin (alkyl hydroperoxide reductase subunit C)|nr:peroxiredoxin [Campylobacterota bacterium]NPA89293.1 peroxiredoxin [Campylobacterota bacterium]
MEEKKECTQAGVLVLKKMPEFKAEAFDASTGHYTEVSSDDYKGKWTVICFYPADFTFVCPTEIAAMNTALPYLKELGVEVLAVSTDTKFSHKRFVETEPLLTGLKLKIAADPTLEMSKKFGVLIEDAGLALRGRFLINPDGVIVAQEVQAPPVGRSIKEFIRQIIAHQHAYKTGEVCPANWRPGKKTLPVNTDIEPMTGNVGKYVTIDEIVTPEDIKEIEELVKAGKGE